MVLKIGILGGANISRKVSRAINTIPDVAEVVVVGSRSLDKAKSFIKETGLKNAQPVEGYDAVLDFPGVEAAYIPLPTSLHVEWVRKAAAKGLHIVLEKPIALTDEDTAAIVSAVRDAGVVLFDGTMWMHHPRTALMQTALEEAGGAQDVTSMAVFKGTEDFFKNDVRVKKDADALGCLGDCGWYSVRAILWAFGFEVPTEVRAHAGSVFNEEGVPIHVGATLVFPGGKRGRFECGFDVTFNHSLNVASNNGGWVYLRDFIIPKTEHDASFVVTSDDALVDMFTRITTKEETRTVHTDLTQEALLFVRFASEIEELKKGGKPPVHWLRIAALTQRILNAIFDSVQNDCANVPFHFDEAEFLPK